MQLFKGMRGPNGRGRRRCTLALYGYGEIGLPPLGSRDAICPMEGCYEDQIPGTDIHENEDGSEEPRFEWRCEDHSGGLFADTELSSGGATIMLGGKVIARGVDVQMEIGGKRITTVDTVRRDGVITVVGVQSKFHETGTKLIPPRTMGRK